MLSSIGSIGVQAQSQAVDQLFKNVDSNRDGKITKGELTQALESDSVEIGSSNQESDVDQIFRLLDVGNKGYITKQDATDALAERQPTSAADATAKSASGPGGGGGGGASTSVSADIDPADTNEDGTVSIQEELAYIMKQYTASDSKEQAQSATYA